MVVVESPQFVFLNQENSKYIIKDYKVKTTETLFFSFLSDAPKPFGAESNLEKVGFERSIGFGSPESKFCSKSATEQSTIIVEKRDERNEILECSPVKSVVYTKSVTALSSANNSRSNEPATKLTTNSISTTKVTEQISTTAVKKSIDYSSVVFNSVGPSKTSTLPVQNNASQKVTQKQNTVPSKPQQSLSDQNRTPNSSKTKMMTKMNLNSKVLQSSQNQEKTTPVSSHVEKVNRTPTSQKHDHDHSHRHSAATYFASQNLLAPLKNDKNFISKIVCIA